MKLLIYGDICIVIQCVYLTEHLYCEKAKSKIFLLNKLQCGSQSEHALACLTIDYLILEETSTLSFICIYIYIYTICLVSFLAVYLAVYMCLCIYIYIYIYIYVYIFRVWMRERECVGYVSKCVQRCVFIGR